MQGPGLTADDVQVAIRIGLDEVGVDGGNTVPDGQSTNDWASFYLAMLNGVDPTPVNVIDYLKRQLDRQ